MKLYEIKNEYINICDNLIDEETGEINQQELAKIEKALQEKNTNIVKVYKNKKIFLEAMQEEIKKLEELYKTETNKLKRFEEYIAYNFERLGIKNFETPAGKITLKETKAIEVYDESLLDEKYYNIKTTKTISKTKIKEDIEKGVEVQGAKQVINRKVGIK